MGAALAVVDGREDLRTMATTRSTSGSIRWKPTAKAPTLREISGRFMASRFGIWKFGISILTAIRTARQ
jgi:hypothetical protein